MKIWGNNINEIICKNGFLTPNTKRMSRTAFNNKGDGKTKDVDGKQLKSSIMLKW